MAYRRPAVPAILRGEELTAAMAGVGMNFAAGPAREPNIEDTLLGASFEGMVGDDLRVLSVLVAWMEVHSPVVNADRLIRGVRALDAARVTAFWAACAQWLHSDRRFARLVSLHRGGRVDLLKTGTAFQIARKGEDERFARTVLRIPAGTLRRRPGDVATAQEMVRRHAVYRQRVMMGPTYRADMWAALQGSPELGAADLARVAYGSFATAWQVKRDYALLQMG